uniref:Ig-like domain-containing protein n=1 Tax=Podarcis muralis TaxID=64176 RepID=A0A670INC9_PODMU
MATPMCVCVCSYIFTPSVLFPAALEVKTSPSPVVGLVHNPVVLHCNFTVQESIRKEDVALKWAVKTVSGEERAVFLFDGNHTAGYRHGPLVNVELLPHGIASLTLSDVTLRDEGIYTCTVLVTPQYGNGKIQLKVRDSPHHSLSWFTVPRNIILCH